MDKAGTAKCWRCGATDVYWEEVDTWLLLVDAKGHIHMCGDTACGASAVVGHEAILADPKSSKANLKARA